jgi:crotonobetainyl-CoA:carnitine CoA-transferase CaiB-like acyl-CoA transferase
MARAPISSGSTAARNRSALDLKQADDRQVLMTMVGQADIIIQNLAPGAVERLGFGAEALRARFPRLITCSISGYGDEGPLRELKAYDLLVQAESGLSAITGNEHGSARRRRVRSAISPPA